MVTEELIEVFDEQGKRIGTEKRSVVDANDLIIESVLIFVFTPDNKLWVQKRAKSKKHFPGLWDISACGAVSKAEKPATTAKREQLEEMGFNSKLTFVEYFANKFIGSDKIPTTWLSYLFVGVSDQTPTPNDEVEEFRAFPVGKLRQRLIDHPKEFVPSFLIELDKATTALEQIR